MFSWFPLLFPIRQPVAVQVRFHTTCLVTCRRQLQSSEHCSPILRNAVFNHLTLQAGSIIEVCMWRCVRETKV